MKETIVVWFSCGAASAVAAKKTIEKYGDTHTVRVVNNPMENEDPDNQRFLRDVGKWLGVEIEAAINPAWPRQNIEDVFEKRKYMCGAMGAPCSMELKKKARYHWEKINKFDHVVLGFTSEEVERHERFKQSEPGMSVLPVLIDFGITKDECFHILNQAGIALPAIYYRGYPNANCIGCVKASSSTYWNHVRVQDPDVFASRAEMSRRIGCRLVWYKGKKIYLDELPANAKGWALRKMNVDCGIFCEIK